MVFKTQSNIACEQSLGKKIIASQIATVSKKAHFEIYMCGSRNAFTWQVHEKIIHAPVFLVHGLRKPGELLIGCEC
jgi:hypothetical protein